MFARCPHCRTVFRTSAGTLKAAQGKVRCGRCSTVFDALNHLIDEDELFETPPPAGETPQPEAEMAAFAATPTAADTSAASEHVEEPSMQDADGASTAAQEFQEEDIPDAALEFSGHAEVLEEIFVESPRVTPPVLPAPQDSPPPTASSEANSGREREIDNDEITAEHEILDIEIDAVATETAIGSGAPQTQQPAADSLSSTAKMRALKAGFAELSVQDGEPNSATDFPPASELLSTAASNDNAHDGLHNIGTDGGTESKKRGALPPDVLQEIEAALTAATVDTTPRKGRRWQWAVGSAVLAIVLAIQVIHFNRNSIVDHPTVGPILSDVYARLGYTLTPNWDLGAYEVRQWGAAAGNTNDARLRVRASLFNGAERAQPFPVLRLTLQDRFGVRVGLRDLEPHEYLPATIDSRKMLSSHERIDAEIEILDPGKDAVGFEIDVCLRTSSGRSSAASHAKVRCANERLTQTS